MSEAMKVDDMTTRPIQNGNGVLTTDAPDVPRKAACFLVSSALLHQLLLLPANCEVGGIVWINDRQAYELSVTGDALPDDCLQTPGAAVPRVKPHYKQEAGKPPEFAGWGETSWNR